MTPLQTFCACYLPSSVRCRLFRPFRASLSFTHPDPGRCPGLSYCAPSALRPRARVPDTVQALLSSVQALLSSVQALLSSVQALLSSVQALLSSVQALLSSVQALLSSVQALLSSGRAKAASRLRACRRTPRSQSGDDAFTCGGAGLWSSQSGESQVPNLKSQIPNKLQLPNSKFGTWSLELIWDLVLVIWSFRAWLENLIVC